MNNVHASIESGVVIADGTGYDETKGGRFTTIWVGGGGDIELMNPSGKTFVIPGVQGGAFFPASGIFIGATNTTATGLVACGWGPYDPSR